MSGLRVLLVTPFCDPGSGGGIATHVRATAAALAAAGSETTVLSGRRGGDPPQVDGAALELVEAGDTFDPAFWAQTRARFDALGGSRAFDVVLSEGSSGRGLLDAGLPIVGLAHQFKAVHLRNSWLEVDSPRTLGIYLLKTAPRAIREGWTIERPFFRACRLVVSGAEHMAGLLRRTYGLSDVRVVPNWVDMERFSSADGHRRAEARRAMAVPQGAFVVLTVSRLQRTKGVADLVRGFRRAFPDDGQALLVVGGGPVERDGLERAAAGNDRRVTLAGELSEDRVAAFHKIADVFVLSSRLLEVLPYTLLEAMASGVACVAADRASSREALGDAGLYYPPGDAGALASALQRLREDSELRLRLGAAAHQRASELFAASRRGPELAALIQEAAR